MSSRNSSGRNNGPRAKPYNVRTPDDVGDQTVPADSGPGRVFLLSPANVTGIRAGQILSDCAQSELRELQMRLRREGVTLGELFCFISGLYFRGKLAYARAFARGPRNFPGTYVITACGGLIPPETLQRITLLRRTLMQMNPIQAMEMLVKKLGDTPSNAAFLDKISMVVK